MVRHPPISTLTDTLFPYPTLVRSPTAALDPTQSEPAPAPARGGKPAAASAAPASQDAILKAADASIRAMMLIRTYRVRGHLAANLDPLGLSDHEMPDDLRID